MEYSKIVAVSGLPGLFELITSKSDGAIVRSLEDKSTRFVASRVHNFSHLESIEIFTIRENVNLVDVFHAMEKSGTALPDDKDPSAVRKYFEKTFPDLDFDRVYASDMKKMIKWFDALRKNNVEIKLSETVEPAGEESSGAEEPAEEAPSEKPAKKTAKKSAKKDTATEAETPKKTAKKKSGN